jgi:hypothetical protein
LACGRRWGESVRRAFAVPAAAWGRKGMPVLSVPHSPRPIPPPSPFEISPTRAPRGRPSASPRADRPTPGCARAPRPSGRGPAGSVGAVAPSARWRSRCRRAAHAAQPRRPPRRRSHGRQPQRAARPDRARRGDRRVSGELARRAAGQRAARGALRAGCQRASAPPAPPDPTPSKTASSPSRRCAPRRGGAGCASAPWWPTTTRVRPPRSCRSGARPEHRSRCSPQSRTPPPPGHPAGQFAVVSGGSEGIGLGVADALAGYGVAVALVSRSQAKLDRAAAFLRGRHPGVEVVTVAADLTADGATQQVGGRGMQRPGPGPPPGLSCGPRPERDPPAAAAAARPTDPAPPPLPPSSPARSLRRSRPRVCRPARWASSSATRAAASRARRRTRSLPTPSWTPCASEGPRGLWGSGGSAGAQRRVPLKAPRAGRAVGGLPTGCRHPELAPGAPPQAQR